MPVTDDEQSRRFAGNAGEPSRLRSSSRPLPTAAPRTASGPDRGPAGGLTARAAVQLTFPANEPPDRYRRGGTTTGRGYAGSTTWSLGRAIHAHDPLILRRPAAQVCRSAGSDDLRARVPLAAAPWASGRQAVGREANSEQVVMPPRLPLASPVAARRSPWSGPAGSMTTAAPRSSPGRAGSRRPWSALQSA